MDKQRLENDFQERLVNLAFQIFPWNNDYGKKDSINKLLRVLEVINPGEYRLLHRDLFLTDSEIKCYDEILPISERLEKLAIRLDDDGQYVNSNICWLALKELQKGIDRKQDLV